MATRVFKFIGLVAILVLINFVAPAAVKATTPPAADADRPLVIAIGSDPETFNPLQIRARTTWNLLMHVTERLFARDKDMVVKPWLVESYERPDDFTWKLKLRKGIKFSSGDELKASDVKFTILETQNPKWKSPNTFVTETNVDLNNIEVLDDYTVVLHTKKPAPLLMDSADFLPIISEKQFKTATDAEIGQRPVGTGPYVIKEYVKDDHVTLERRDNYWGTKPDYKTVIYRPIPNNQTRLAELLAGNADIILNLSPDDLGKVKSTPGLRVETVQGGRDVFIGIMCTVEPFTDKRVRQALNYAVDLESIFKNLLGGNGTRMTSVTNLPTKLKPYTYDPMKAAQLLDEAGLVDSNKDGVREWKGKPVQVELGTTKGRYVMDAAIAQAVASDLTAAGIKTEAKAYEWSVYVDMINGKKLPPLFFLGLGSSFNGEQEFFYVQKDFAFNSTQWLNNDFEKTFAELQRTMDPKVRVELIDKIDQVVQDDSPWIFIWKQVDFYGANNRVEFKARPDELVMLFDVHPAAK